jgi:hypothetical protein
MVGFDKRMYKIAEEFGLELIHSGEATALAKKLYVSYFFVSEICEKKSSYFLATQI